MNEVRACQRSKNLSGCPYYCTRTFVSTCPGVLVPALHFWPPYLRMSARSACFLDSWANVSLLCDSHVAARQSHRLSLAAVRREPASEQLRCLLCLL
ncbi:hypothetical protein HDV57DRAFT_418095 [Trichoderma longibrachiatum]